MPTRDDLLLPLLAQPFTAEQARAAGLERDDLAALLRVGVIRRLWRGCYASEHLDDDITVWAQAAARSLPDGCVVAGRSSAFLQGVDILSRPAVLEVLAVVQRRPRARAGLRVRETSRLPDDDIVHIAGVPCTTAARTAADLARWDSPREGLVAVDSLTHAGLCSVDEIAAQLACVRGRRWTQRALAVLDLCEPLTESPQESRTRYEWVIGGAPRPVVQHVVVHPVSNAFVARLDLALPEELIGGEYDGVDAHSAEDAFAHDRVRQNELTALGWKLIRWTSRDIWTPRPRIAADVLRLLANAS